MTQTDLGTLRSRFSDAIAKLPDYKRRDAWEFVKALEDVIAKRDKEINELADHNITQGNRNRVLKAYIRFANSLTSDAVAPQLRALELSGGWVRLIDSEINAAEKELVKLAPHTRGLIDQIREMHDVNEPIEDLLQELNQTLIPKESDEPHG